MCLFIVTHFCLMYIFLGCDILINLINNRSCFLDTYLIKNLLSVLCVFLSISLCCEIIFDFLQEICKCLLPYKVLFSFPYGPIILYLSSSWWKSQINNYLSINEENIEAKKTTGISFISYKKFIDIGLTDFFAKKLNLLVLLLIKAWFDGKSSFRFDLLVDIGHDTWTSSCYMISGLKLIIWVK